MARIITGLLTWKYAYQKQACLKNSPEGNLKMIQRCSQIHCSPLASEGWVWGLKPSACSVTLHRKEILSAQHLAGLTEKEVAGTQTEQEHTSEKECFKWQKTTAKSMSNYHPCDNTFTFCHAPAGKKPRLTMDHMGSKEQESAVHLPLIH